MELPLYLLPWTFVIAAALTRAWRQARAPGVAGTPWRFALSASVPFLALLSVAATARDVYAAPAMLGFGLLAGLWAHELQRSPSAVDELALRLTRWLVLAIAWLLAFALALLAVAGAGSRWLCLSAALGTLVVAYTALLPAARAQRTGAMRQSLGWIYAGYAAAFCVAAVAAFPIIDRWQDLPALARHIHADTAGHSLALLNPDETTIAMLDRGLETRFTILTSAATADSSDTAAQVVGDWLAAHGPEARVLVLLPGHAPGRLTPWLARFKLSPPGDGEAGRLIASGTALLAARYELPHGRRYALLGPPHQASPVTRANGSTHVANRHRPFA